MLTPYVVIKVVENGFTVEVCGVALPRSFVYYTPEEVADRIRETLPHLVKNYYVLSPIRPMEQGEPS